MNCGGGTSRWRLGRELIQPDRGSTQLVRGSTQLLCRTCKMTVLPHTLVRSIREGITSPSSFLTVSNLRHLLIRSVLMSSLLSTHLPSTLAIYIYIIYTYVHMHILYACMHICMRLHYVCDSVYMYVYNIYTCISTCNTHHYETHQAKAAGEVGSGTRPSKLMKSKAIELYYIIQSTHGTE